MTLEELYQYLKNRQLIPEMESLDIVKKVEEYKLFWKPENVKTILLAESHVFTSKEDFSVKIVNNFIPDQEQPRNYARYVYCLGYGENSILDKPIYKNPGTWQYWELFFSCNQFINTFEQYAPVLKTGNPVLENRIHSKNNTLQQLKELGVWLIDACPFALYSNRRGTDLRQNYRLVIDNCWGLFIREQIEEADPKSIIVIGHNVYNGLSEHLSQLSENIQIYKFYQPQARISSEEHLRQYQDYFRICNQE